MIYKYAGLTAVEILKYDYTQHKVINQRNGVKKVLLAHLGKNIILQVMPDGSRTLTTKDQIVTVCQDAETRRISATVVDRKYKKIRRYIDGKLGSLDGLPAIEHTEEGTKEWYIDGVRGRENGLPALELSNGDRWWYINGIRARADGLPAIEYADGTKVWYIEERVGRDDGPHAAVYVDSTKEWYINGKLGRSGGLPAVVYPDCSAEWYENGVRYTPEGRVDLITEDFTAHYNNGKLHSYDLQPAVTYKDGRLDEYYINGEKTTLELLQLVTQKYDTIMDLKNVKNSGRSSSVKF